MENKLIKCRVTHPYKPYNVGDIGEFPESEVKRVPHALKPVDAPDDSKIKAEAIAALRKKNDEEHEARRESYRSQHEAALQARAINAYREAMRAKEVADAAQKAVNEYEANKATVAATQTKGKK